MLGYLFSRSIDSVINYAGKGAFALGALIVIVVGIVALRRYLRVEENRRAAVRWMEAHAATRWIVAPRAPLQPAARASSGTGSRRAGPSASSSPR